MPGDWARVEENGTITLLGRGNTCVNTGGEKVFPEEAEGALIQLRRGATADAAALQAQVRGQLAGYKVPRTVWFVDSVGRTVSGKADYGWARQYVAEHLPAPSAPPERTP